MLSVHCLPCQLCPYWVMALMVCSGHADVPCPTARLQDIHHEGNPDNQLLAEQLNMIDANHTEYLSESCADLAT